MVFGIYSCYFSLFVGKELQLLGGHDFLRSTGGQQYAKLMTLAVISVA
jgi:hypothetical protein